MAEWKVTSNEALKMLLNLLLQLFHFSLFSKIKINNSHHTQNKSYAPHNAFQNIVQITTILISSKCT